MTENTISKLYEVNKKTGFTIPYLIGVEYYKNKKEISVNDIFKTILEFNSDKIYYLHHCPNIGEFVISISHPIYKMKGIEIKNQAQQTKLILTLNTEILGKNLIEIVNKLNERYSNCILNKKFSFINRNWLEFEKEEIEKIKLL